MSIQKWDKGIEAKVIYAFLRDGKSHRRIQEEILKIEAPVRGGGFETMKILHRYGIDGSKKGILASVDIETELAAASTEYALALRLIK